jgi:hypothetical protein
MVPKRYMGMLGKATKTSAKYDGLTTDERAGEPPAREALALHTRWAAQPPGDTALGNAHAV